MGGNRLMKNMIRASGIIIALALCIGAAALASHVHPSLCVGCGDCVRICPVSAVTMVRGKAVIDVERCDGCKKCNAICSYGAIR
jgi:Fe-S-cluster-containing hydrogenase component 2